MGVVRRFEDLEAWLKARELTREVYRASSGGRFSKDFALRDQVRRAGVSIMSNIAEGFERGGNKEFLQFLSVAKASAGEVRSQLYVAVDQGYIAEDEFTRLCGLAKETSRIVSGLMAYLRKSKKMGSKYRQQ